MNSHAISGRLFKTIPQTDLLILPIVNGMKNKHLKTVISQLANASITRKAHKLLDEGRRCGRQIFQLSNIIITNYLQLLCVPQDLQVTPSQVTYFSHSFDSKSDSLNHKSLNMKFQVKNKKVNDKNY